MECFKIDKITLHLCQWNILQIELDTLDSSHTVLHLLYFWLPVFILFIDGLALVVSGESSLIIDYTLGGQNSGHCTYLDITNYIEMANWNQLLVKVANKSVNIDVKDLILGRGSHACVLIMGSLTIVDNGDKLQWMTVTNYDFSYRPCSLYYSYQSPVTDY